MLEKKCLINLIQNEISIFNDNKWINVVLMPAKLLIQIICCLFFVYQMPGKNIILKFFYLLQYKILQNPRLKTVLKSDVKKLKTRRYVSPLCHFWPNSKFITLSEVVYWLPLSVNSDVNRIYYLNSLL